MKYYEEEKMRQTREKMEKEILAWDFVSTKKMFGCPCYYKNKKRLFAFLVTDGIVIIRLDDKGKSDLSNAFNTKPFNSGTRNIGSWMQASIKDGKDTERVMKFIRKSYDLS